jgi:hypothetical protein
MSAQSSQELGGIGPDTLQEFFWETPIRAHFFGDAHEMKGESGPYFGRH